jgi:hypothetical protein
VPRRLAHHGAEAEQREEEEVLDRVHAQPTERLDVHVPVVQ